jgi:acetyl-CoA carboxylase carboxyl transferase subunit alpha
VISPESASSILLRSADKAPEMASALKLTAQDARDLKLIDAIVPEPEGGAHRAPGVTIAAMADQIAQGLSELEGMSGEQLVKARREKYLAMGRTL